MRVAGRRVWLRPSMAAGFAAGAIFGIALCAALVLTCGRREGGPASTGGSGGQSGLEKLVVAHAGRVSITPKDIRDKIRLQFPNLGEQKGIGELREMWEVLQSMLDQYSWVYVGERHGVDKDPEYVASLELSRKYLLAQMTVERLVYDKAAATDDEVRQYYEDNPDQFHMVARAQASLILLPTQKDAERIAGLLRAGSDFSDLAHKYSIDKESNLSGGDIGTVTLRSEIRGFGIRPAINQAIMALKVGEISAPLQTDRGWCVCKVREMIPEQQQALEEVRDQIRKKISAKRTNELFSTTLVQAKKEAGSSVDRDAWNRYVVSRLGDDDVLKFAQGEKNPKDRAAIFQTLADQRPASPRAPQALFMAGFIYADDLRDYPTAKKYFQEMVDKYPKSDMSEPANWMIQNMDKGLENFPQVARFRQLVTGG